MPADLLRAQTALPPPLPPSPYSPGFCPADWETVEVDGITFRRKRQLASPPEPPSKRAHPSPLLTNTQPQGHDAPRPSSSPPRPPPAPIEAQQNLIQDAAVQDVEREEGLASGAAQQDDALQDERACEGEVAAAEQEAALAAIGGIVDTLADAEVRWPRGCADEGAMLHSFVGRCVHQRNTPKDPKDKPVVAAGDYACMHT